jgi:hypothetical protein
MCLCRIGEAVALKLYLAEDAISPLIEDLSRRLGEQGVFTIAAALAWLTFRPRAVSVS